MHWIIIYRRLEIHDSRLGETKAKCRFEMYNLISSELFSKLSTTNDEADQPYKVNHYRIQTSMMFIIHVSSSIRHVQKPRVVNHSIYGYTVESLVLISADNLVSGMVTHCVLEWNNQYHDFLIIYNKIGNIVHWSIPDV